MSSWSPGNTGPYPSSSSRLHVSNEQDFRSADGLYALVKSRYPDSFVNGKELFSSGLFMNPNTTSIFYTFIAELSLACQAANPTRTHHFIHRLERKGKLLRSYTQNVDGFERRLGIESGGRGRGLKKNGTRNVELHGDLGRVRCVLCYTDYEARQEWVLMFREGEAPECPACQARCKFYAIHNRHGLTGKGESRIARSARATPIGSLRPSIVLYDEPHPLGDEIGQLQTYDMRRGPDVLLIMGTSLKVHGLKRLVKDFARVVHEKKGVVVFVNATAPSKEWEGVIDYHIEGQTDAWVERFEEDWRKICPRDWEKQTNLDGNVVFGSVAKSKPKPKAKRRVPEVSIPVRSHSCEHIPLQLPTPPASQQSPPPSEASELSDLSDVLSSPPSSPVLAPAKDLEPPLTPVSPSKRGTPSTVTQQSKKTKPPPASPSTGKRAIPGRGNLFTESQYDNLLSSSSDDNVFGSPTKSMPKAPAKSKKASAANAKAAEVAKPKPRRRAAGGADKETAGLGSRGPLRRTNSLRAC